MRHYGWILSSFFVSQVFALPADFVYLDRVDPSILQDIRYAQDHNFVGRPVIGYQADTCILTKPAALALHHVQQQLKKSHLSLKVYDCYRPQQAVDDFVRWSQRVADQTMKAEFYPAEDKARAFNDGYIARKSGHTRGGTIDLTIVAMPVTAQAPYKAGQPLVACTAPYHVRYRDNSIDMGTGYDCFDPRAFVDNAQINTVAKQHRQLLRQAMMQYHFVPYEKEWWHFTLDKEPYPNTYFNFPVAKENIG